MVLADGRSTARHFQSPSVNYNGAPFVLCFSKFADQLQELPWREVKASRGHITRSSCWLTATDCTCVYKYGKLKSDVWQPAHLPEWIEHIARGLEDLLDLPPNMFNACNCNRNSGSSEDLYWHSDDEPLFRSPKDRNVSIASVSFGASGNFGLRPKYHEPLGDIVLKDADFFTMEGLCQDDYQH